MKYCLTCLFPPSVNQRYAVIPGQKRLILTSKTRQWLKEASQVVFFYCRQTNIPTINKYTFFDLFWFVPSLRYDHHNLEKALFDAMQKGGLVKNDRFILNRTQAVSVDPSEPRVEVQFEI